jgi:hypothetical protein
MTSSDNAVVVAYYGFGCGNHFTGSELIIEERHMPHNSNTGFFVMIGSSLLAAALLVALLVGGEVAGPKVAFNSPSSTSAR